MSRSAVRAAFPLPRAIRDWPGALRPGRAIATSAGLELVYRSPRAGEVRVLAERAGARVLVPGRDKSLAARLAAQVAARVRTLPPKTREAMERVRRALAGMEGTPPLSGALGTFQRLQDASDAELPEEPEGAQEPLAAWGVAALRAGDFRGALRALDRREGTPQSTVGDVLLLAFAGLGVTARGKLDPPGWISPMSAIAWENVAIALLDWGAAHRFSRAHVTPNDPARLVVAMQLALAAGEFDWAGRAALRVLALDATPEQQDAALLACTESGYANAAATWLEERSEPDPSLVLRAAEIAVHRRRLEDAQTWLRKLGSLDPALSLRAARVRGALALAAGRYDDAVKHLEPVLEAWPRDRETTILLGEAHLRAHRHRDGMDVLERFNKKVTGEHPAAKLLLGFGSLPALYEAPGMERAPGSTLYLHRNIAFDVLGERPSFGPDDIEQERAFILRTLDAFGGNRSDTLTVLADGELHSARHVQDPRVHVVEAQHAVLTESVEDARARLHRLGRERPDVPYPRTYEAEIDLWRGDYARSTPAFEAVYTETGTRWGYVGWGASLAMQGQAERAIEVLDEGVRRLKGAIDGEATPAYRGEALLSLGRLDEALADLQKATTLRPRRLGTWATFALALRQAGQPGAEEARDHFLESVPVLAWEAQKLRKLPPTLPVAESQRWAVLETARERLRGNRSSYLLTFFDAQDRWRVHEIAGHLPRMREMAERIAQGVTSSALEVFLARQHGE